MLSLTCMSGVLACGRNATDSDEQLAAPSALTISATAKPDTVALSDELVLTLSARNPLAIGVRAPGPCPWLPLRLQVVGADSIRRYALIGGAGGCKLPDGPATVRLSPGWVQSLASRGAAHILLPPGTPPGLYRLRGAYEAPTDTAFGAWFLLWVTP